MKVIFLNSASSPYNDYRVLEFSNEIGVVFNDCVLIFSHSSKKPIDLDYIKRIELKKQENFFWNYFFFAFGLGVLVSFYYCTLSVLEYSLLSVFAILFFLLSFKLNNSFYYLYIKRPSLSYLEIKIRRHQKNDAIEFVAFINEKNKVRNVS